MVRIQADCVLSAGPDLPICTKPTLQTTRALFAFSKINRDYEKLFDFVRPYNYLAYVRLLVANAALVFCYP